MAHRDKPQSRTMIDATSARVMQHRIQVHAAFESYPASDTKARC